MNNKLILGLIGLLILGCSPSKESRESKEKRIKECVTKILGYKHELGFIFRKENGQTLIIEKCPKKD